MGRELEIKRRQLSTHPHASIRSRQGSAMEGSTEQSQPKEGVRRLVPSVPNEQVEMLKTNVGRLKICKRHIVPTTVVSSGLSSSGSKGVASRLKLVRPNRVLGGQSIFEQNGKKKVSIKEKISQSVVPLNSNQFSKGEDGRWTKLDQPAKKLSISNLRATTTTKPQTANKISKEKTQVLHKYPQGLGGSDREEDSEHEGSVQEEYDDLGDQEKDEDLVEMIVEQKKADRKQYREEQVKGNKQAQTTNVKNVQNKVSSQVNNTKPLNAGSSNNSNIKQQSVAGGAQSIPSNNNNNSNNSSNQVQKQPPTSSNTDQSTLFVVAVNNLPRKCTESDIRSLLSSEKKDLVEVVLEEGDSYDCLLYFTTELSQLRTVKLLDNKKYEGQILRADPAEVIIEKQEQDEGESQKEIDEEHNEEVVQDEYNDDNDNEDYQEDDRYVEETRQQSTQNSRIQQSQQQSKNLISSHIRSNDQTRSDYSQSSNPKRTSQVAETSRSSRIQPSQSSQQQQQQQEVAQRKPREIEQQESRNVRNNDILQNQQQQQSNRQVKNTKKDQQQQQRDSTSRSRDRTTGRYNNNTNNNDQTRGGSHARSSAGREEDISQSRSNSGRNRSESGNNQRRNRRSPSPRYNNNTSSNSKKGDSRQPNIIKRSRYPASPVRSRDSPPPRDRRNSGNVRDRREIITNERQQRRDSTNERQDRHNASRKYSRERNSRRRESPRRDGYSRR